MRFSVLFGTRTWDPLHQGPPANSAAAPFQESVSLEQVHGDRLHLVGSLVHARTFPREGDGLVTRVSGLALVLSTADCLPLMLVDNRARVVAAVHAGWRGVAAGLPRIVVERLAAAFEVHPSRLRAFLGPAICRKCFPVGEEVIEAVGRSLPPGGLETVVERQEGKAHLDLAGAVRLQLLAAGLGERTIHGGLPCTACQGEMFHSHRASGGSAGRLHSLIYLHPRDEREEREDEEHEEEAPAGEEGGSGR